MVTAQARDLYRRFEAVPRPDGFRIVESGAIVYEFAESPDPNGPRGEKRPGWRIGWPDEPLSMSYVCRQWTTPISWQLSRVTIFAAKGDARSIIFGIRK